ncbi:putative type II secretion system protein E [Methanocella conradii HZ254]|uniref:Type II secretion system protein E n=1 Tax=Methanocella conradii (strain DSM 24694 / JCM 17849 / CGMCC 1.5162 / HZ254) TaxID=1041930 RepID=H8I5X0_METCZ|nr:type II/IV secretion system ATPase subunit [Methanocella conradii]AFC99787.1 putative type II secretion system protein E [Methanocella conradii HZ254]
MKKKVIDSEAAGPASKKIGDSVEKEKSVISMLGIDATRAPQKAEAPVKLMAEAAEDRASLLLKSSPPPSPTAAQKPDHEPTPAGVEPEPPLNGQLKGEAIDAVGVDEAPAESKAEAYEPSIESGLETQIQPSVESLGSEEDILKEFNSIIKPEEGIIKAEVEEKKEKGGRKEKARLRQKIVFEPYDPEKHGPMAIFTGVPGYEEVERYWVDEPYAFVVILYNESTNNYLYYVVEPSLTVFEKELLIEVYDRLQDVLMMEKLDATTDKKQLLKEKTTQIINDYIGKIDTKSYYKILYYINRDYLEFGKINPIMHDSFIEDISNNGFDTPVFLYHKNYENIMTNIVFSEKQLDSYVIRLAQRCGKHISIAEPMVDATMPDGSRIQMTLGKEITTRGSTFTIRKFKEVPITPIDLIAWNTFSSEEMAYLWLCIENNKSLLFSGGTASGKTSSLNAVSLFIPPKAKVISLEDTRELKLPHMNWIPGLTRDSFTADGKGAIEMFALLKAALRQRPEYLLVGEVRGKEALTLFQAMSTGHTTFSTMHADSVESAIHRLENPPISVPRTMITALDIVSIQAQTYLKNKRVRRNMKLVEINDIDPNTRNIRTNDIFVWNSATDKFDRVGESRVLAEIAQRRAWSKRELSNELLRRQKVLEYMLNNNIREFRQIAAIIHAYAVKPGRVVEKLGIKV